LTDQSPSRSSGQNAASFGKDGNRTFAAICNKISHADKPSFFERLRRESVGQQGVESAFRITPLLQLKMGASSPMRPFCHLEFVPD